MLTPQEISSFRPDIADLQLVMEERIRASGTIVFRILIFTFPVFWIFDFILLHSWQAAVAHTGVASACGLCYFLFTKKYIGAAAMLHGVFFMCMLCHCIVAATAPAEAARVYFSILCVLMLCISMVITCRPVGFVLHVLIQLMVTGLLMYASGSFTFIALTERAAVIYCIVSLLSCLLVVSRFRLVKKHLAQELVIEKQKQQLLEQEQKINDLVRFRRDKLRLILHDVRNFAAIVTMIMDSIQDERDTINPRLQIALRDIEESNEKLMRFLTDLSASLKEQHLTDKATVQ